MVEVRVRTVHEATADWRAEHSLDLYRDGVFVTSRGIVTGSRETAEAEASSLERGIAFDERTTR